MPGPCAGHFISAHQIVVPAKAGTHLSTVRASDQWIPAFAGMTEDRIYVVVPPLSPVSSACAAASRAIGTR